MAIPSDLFSFDNVADDSAKARQADVAANTIGMVSNMMNANPATATGQTATSATPTASYKMAESNPAPASLGTWISNSMTLGRETNPFTGTNPGAAFTNNTSIDLARVLRAKGLGSIIYGTK